MGYWIGVVAAALLRIAFIWLDEGIYPGLPADFIPVDFFVFVFGLPAALLLAVAMVARRAGTGSLLRWAPRLSAFFAAPALVLAPDIVGRQFGRWADLRHELALYQHDVERYVREHGPVSTEAKAEALAKIYPSREFAFRDSGPVVYIVYRWWWGDQAQALIIWGRGRSAAFDLQTMICEHVD
jgi:hypothetical protein